MVAKFQTGSSLRNILNYNEKKVEKGDAELLAAINYPLACDKLPFDLKLKILTHRAELNENVRANSVHISINYGTSDQLNNEQLVEIAEQYMDKIGFSDQPYLIYRHYDAGHLHTHIVSVKIAADGKRLETHNIGRNQSRQACVELEKSYGLTRTSIEQTPQNYTLEPINAQRVQYGKTETKRAINNVLHVVLDKYIFASLPELNAILKQYNVEADRGSETSRIYRHGGLVYRVLDEQGNRIGIPIKASAFHMKPTLVNLQQKFDKNVLLKKGMDRRIKNAIDLAFMRGGNIALPELRIALNKEGIAIIIRQSNNGVIYGITYVDHKNKVVFNGSDLGKAYSAKAIQERCEQGHSNTKEQADKKAAPHQSMDKAVDILLNGDITSDLLQQEFTGETLPYELRKKKKKRKGLSH